MSYKGCEIVEMDSKEKNQPRRRSFRIQDMLICTFHPIPEISIRREVIKAVAIPIPEDIDVFKPVLYFLQQFCVCHARMDPDCNEIVACFIKDLYLHKCGLGIGG